MKPFTLRVRITLAVGLVVAAACALLTLHSLYSADTAFDKVVSLTPVLDIARQPEVNYSIEVPTQIHEADETLPSREAAGGEEPVTFAAFTIVASAKQTFNYQGLLVMCGIILASIAATYAVAGRMLRPLSELNERIGEVGAQNLDARLPAPKTRDEVGQLTDSFNVMLGRLEAAFSNQKRFSANAAHELKTPLAAMKTSLQVLEMDDAPPVEDYQEFVQDMGESVGRLIQCVEALWSLADDNPLAPSREIPLRPLLERITGELSGPIAEKGIRLTLPEGGCLRGDPALLYRLFFNLLENAVKYNVVGGALAVGVESTEAGRVEVRVSDSGIGIPPDELGHIFEPFYRVDPSRSQQIPGNGLGMAIAKAVVERHGGSITAESELGRGTVFAVCLDGDILCETDKRKGGAL